MGTPVKPCAHRNSAWPRILAPWRVLVCLLVATAGLLLAAPARAQPECPGLAELTSDLGAAGGGAAVRRSAAGVLSALNPRERREKQAAFLRALDGTVLPGVACALQSRALDLARSSSAPGPDWSMLARNTVAWETQAQRLRTLQQVAANDPAAGMASLQAIVVYLHGQPLPAQVLPPPVQAGKALARSRPVAIELPPGWRQAMGSALSDRLAAQQQQLLQDLRAAPARLARLQATAAGRDARPDLPDDVRAVLSWLQAVRNLWLSAGGDLSPCRAIRAQAGAELLPLVQQFGYDASWMAGIQHFDDEQCLAPAKTLLLASQVAPFGPVVVVRQGVAVLNPGLDALVPGLRDLMALPAMRQPMGQPWLCRASPQWDLAGLAQAQSLAQDYLRLQSAAPPAALGESGALYLAIAAIGTEQAMNSAWLAAQPAVVAGDDELVVQDTRWVRPMLDTLALYSRLGFTASGARAAHCARASAAAVMQRLDALASASSLYQPRLSDATGSDDAPLLQLGGGPVLKDYLARQVDRVRSLAGVAGEIEPLLTTTAAVYDGQGPLAMDLAYWQATRAQLKRHAQGDGPGQVQALHALIIRAAGLSRANCREQLAADPPMALGNDLFSRHRQQLGETLLAYCAHARLAQWDAMYQPLAQRFNRELAGRYPFGPQQAVDASMPVVSAFLAEYLRIRAGLTAGLQGERPACLKPQREFLASLDHAAAFLGAGQGVSGRLVLKVHFRSRPGESPGSEQLVGWQLHVDDAFTSYPDQRAGDLHWGPGSSVALLLRWADRSPWHPAADPAQPSMTVDGRLVAFSPTGPWALLRLIEAHRIAPPAGAQVLAFRVPVRPSREDVQKTSSQALLHVDLALSLVDPRTQLEQPFSLVVPWPHLAPTDVSTRVTSPCRNPNP